MTATGLTTPGPAPILTGKQVFDGAPVELMLNAATSPPAVTVTALGVCWTHHWFTSRVPGVAAVWKTHHEGQSWELVGRATRGGGEGCFWLLTAGGATGHGRNLTRLSIIQIAAVWAGRIIAGAGPAFFTP
jgi:hypothetical protein